MAATPAEIAQTSENPPARTFRAPGDFRGAVVGMQEGGVAAATIRALGGRPRAEPQEINPTGLDAYEQQIGAAAGNALYLEAHYLSDVLAGVSLGAAWASASLFVYESKRHGNVRNLLPPRVGRLADRLVR